MRGVKGVEMSCPKCGKELSSFAPPEGHKFDFDLLLVCKSCGRAFTHKGERLREVQVKKMSRIQQVELDPRPAPFAPRDAQQEVSAP